ncbi:hypothetical protein C8R46DRAFT_1060655 [Mycena filopes]|nr:hypothetical protein C8R46DRAFT_1060655 [Mycena filopes]
MAATYAGHAMDRPNLPVELLCQVLYLLEVDDILRCGAVNRYFRNLITESSRLQFTIELAKHRMLSLMPPTEFPPFSTRLKLLRDRERNWRSPQLWGTGQKLSLPPGGNVYEFCGGTYANGREDESKITSGISFFQLPSTEPTTSDEPLATWTHDMGGLKIVDFTFDPPQDLLVLVTLAPPQCESVYQLHLRSFATNEPHPDSSLPMGILPCLPKVTEHQVPLETTGAVRVQVAGDLVALLVKEVHDSVSAHLQIWNWRHGSHHSCAMARMAGIEDFTFLSDDTFLIVRPSGRFECYTFENPISCSTAPVLKSSYNLPPLQDGFMYWYICMSSNPAPGQVPRGGVGTGDRVYYPRPDERIHACCLYIFKPTGPGDHHVHSFVFFLNVKMFLDAPPAPRPRDPYPMAINHYPMTADQFTNHYPMATNQFPNPYPMAASQFPNHYPMATDQYPMAINLPGVINHFPPGTNHFPVGTNHFPVATNNFPVDTSQFTVDTSHLPVATSHFPLPPGNHYPSSILDDLEDDLSSLDYAPHPYQLFSPHPSFFTPVNLLQQNPFPPPPTPAAISRSRQMHVRSLLVSSGVETVPWDAWGPQNTRWFDEALSTDWQHALYGLKTIECIDPLNPTLPLPARPADVNSRFDEEHGDEDEDAPTGSAPQPTAVDPQTLPTVSDLLNGIGFDVVDEEERLGTRERLGPAQRHLRLRDYNPYSLRVKNDPSSSDEGTDRKGKGKAKPSDDKEEEESDSRWTRRIVTASSTTPSRGVFVHDIVSSLPYSEVISKEKFNVTDVMMDDCRVLLMQRGKGGKLKGIDILTM